MNSKGFTKINEQTKQDGTGALLICYLISGDCFQLMSDWKLENLPNGKEISIARLEQKKRTTSISKRNFPENYSSISLSTKITGFFLLNGKQPLCPLHHMRVRTELLLIFTDHFKPQRRNYCHSL